MSMVSYHSSCVIAVYQRCLIVHLMIIIIILILIIIKVSYCSSHDNNNNINNNNNNNNNNNKVYIAQVCQMTSEVLDRQLE